MAAEPGWVGLAALEPSLAPTDIPDASAPLLTHLLHADQAGRGRCLLVRFPVGWDRGPGAFECAEVAVVLDGLITLDGMSWRAGQGFVVPAGMPRQRTLAPHGALAVAWFAGAPRWRSGPQPGGADIAGPSSLPWHGSDAACLGSVDLVDPVGWRWAHLESAGSTPPPDVLRYCWSAP